MKRHLWLCALLFTANRLYAQTDDSRIEHISACSEQIDKDSALQKVNMNSKEFLGDESSAGKASMMGYFKGDSVCRNPVAI